MLQILYKQIPCPFSLVYSLVYKTERGEGGVVCLWICLCVCQSGWAHAVIGWAYRRRQYVTTSILQGYRRAVA
jgi:hypothetical protein